MFRGFIDIFISVFNIGDIGVLKVNLEIINKWKKREIFGNLVIIKLEFLFVIRKEFDILLRVI